MQYDPEETLLVNTSWFLNMPSEKSAGIEEFLESETASMQSGNNRFKLPDSLAILPVRNTVAYPGTVTPLVIGRTSSKRLLEDAKPNKSIIGLLTQRNADTDEPGFGQLYDIGTAASILKTIKMPQGSVHIVVHSLARFKLTKPISTRPYLKAKIKLLNSKVKKTKKLRALMVSVRQTADRVIQLNPHLPEEATVLLENIEEPSALADFLAANLNINIQGKQQLLEELDAGKRLEKISSVLASQLEVLELSHKIQSRVRESVDKSQREYFLQEQLKAIQTELGQKDRYSEELNQLKEDIKKADMPRKVNTEALRELDRLSRITAASPEYSVIRTYLDWLCRLPWAVETTEQLDISKAERILNKDHYDLQKVKKRILEFLAVHKLNPRGKSPILCFVGPPGVGKTSLGQSIARAMGRKFVHSSLGGIRDEADIRGHRRTYIGALPGRILQQLGKCGSRNPVFMLDEMDKIGQDFRGDPASALLEVLDPEQNFTFTDHYIDEPFDLSSVMFIGTANYAESIPPALLDRMEIIRLPGYTAGEKLNIARKYLIKRQLAQNGLTKKQITIKNDALTAMIECYTREAGVRNLERTIAAVCRSAAAQIAGTAQRRVTIGKRNLSRILGPLKFESELALRTGISGVATALAHTPVGGEILFIESALMPGKGQLLLTGQIGDVMKESAQAAFSVVRANAEKMKIKPDKFSKFDYHIHVPEGAVPKDGPSAGIAIFISLISLLLKKPVRPDIAMTGEITLRGLVLPVGGLKEKILAAKQAGIKTVILPARNKKDIPEIPAEAKKGLKFEFVRNTHQTLKIALETASKKTRR